MSKIFKIYAAVSMFVLTAAFALPSTASATHSWGGYHWARTSNSFTLQVGDNVSGAWDSFLATSKTDWSKSSVLDLDVVPGGTSAKRCGATTGRMEVCSSTYGNTGWLGVAQIWISGTHITKGTVKVNDTYYNTATYNTPAWRNLVMCQEIGHVLGLDHQDENFNNANLGTCMDYTSSPESNQHPNAHDYEMLEAIYAHTDSFSTVGSIGGSKPGKGNSNARNQSEWGRSIRTSVDGRANVFVQQDGDEEVFTFVVWVPEL